MPGESYTLIERAVSGNCWKIRLCLAELGLPYTSLTPEDLGAERFAAVSRRRRVPVLLEQGREPLVESVAILMRLARGSHLLPEAAADQILSWLVWDQAELCRALALPRLYRRREETELRGDEIARLHSQARVGLEHLDDWLSRHTWLAEGSYSIADLGCHAYVALAPEGGLDTSPYPHVVSWLNRIRSRPHWRPLDGSA